MNQPFAARMEAKGGTRKLFSLSQQQDGIVHILEACRADFIEKNPELAKMYVRDLTLGMQKALANRDETLKVVNEVMKAPIPVLETYLLKDNDFATRLRVLRRTSTRSRRCSTPMSNPECCRRSSTSPS